MNASKLIATAALLLAATSPSALAMTVSASVESKITVEINTAPAPEVYTGIIVDCRGLGLQPVMSPVIKNSDGVIIYGDKNLDPDKIAELGMAAYVKGNNSTSRAGSNPLVVKAVGVENFHSNPVLSVIDAEKVLRANNVSNFLDEASVVFLVD